MVHELETILVSAITTGSIYAPIAFALTLTFNVSGILNLAQGEFFMLAPFVALTLMNHLGFALVPAMLLALAIVTVGAAVLYLLTIAPVRNPREDNVILLTFGLALALAGVALVAFGADSRSFPPLTGLGAVHVGGIAIASQSLWIIGITGVGLVLLWALFTRTIRGAAMRAAADNPAAARMIGLRPRRIACLAFALSGFLGALGGLLAAPLTFVSYSTGISILAKAAIAAVVGGWGSYPGAIVGAYALGLAEAATATYLPTVYGDASALAVLLIIFLARPQGLLRTRALRVRRV